MNVANQVHHQLSLNFEQPSRLMPEPLPYLYVVSNLTGCAIGISDYHFSCVVYAKSEDEAKAWGIDVATEYANKFGFPPHAINPGREQIVYNSCMLPCDADQAAGADHVCHVGEFPDSLL